MFRLDLKTRALRAPWDHVWAGHSHLINKITLKAGDLYVLRRRLLKKCANQDSFSHHRFSVFIKVWPGKFDRLLFFSFFFFFSFLALWHIEKTKCHRSLIKVVDLNPTQNKSIRRLCPINACTLDIKKCLCRLLMHTQPRNGRSLCLLLIKITWYILAFDLQVTDYSCYSLKQLISNHKVIDWCACTWVLLDNE